MSHPDRSFSPSPSSFIGLIHRVGHCPESVSVCSDDELCKLADRRVDPSLNQYVLGELLCRLWLYRGGTELLVEAREKLSKALQAGTLCHSFARRSQDFRQHPKRLSPEEEGEIINDPPCAEFKVAWSFAVRRMVAYLNCDGIIPATVSKMGVAIPFTISPKQNRREFRDWSNRKVQGWIEGAEGLWESLGYGMGIQLACSFGSYLEHFAGKSLVSGESFGLPVLYGALYHGSCNREREFPHPLEVICTGRIADRKIYGVGGIAEKRTLAADKLQAKLFVFADRQDGKEMIDATTHLRFREGTPCREALESMVRHLAGNFDQIELLGELFDPRRHEFRQVIEEYQKWFSGREAKLGSMKSWLLEQLRQRQPACRFVHGEAGCGKSAFMANFAGQVHKDLGLMASFFFFGKSESERDPDVATSLASQLAEYSGYDWELVSREPDPLEQFKLVLNRAVRRGEDGEDIPIFIVDGLDEAEPGNLKQLLKALKEAEHCIWILSGQPHLLDSIRSEVRQVESYPLERLTVREMTQFLEKAAPDLPHEIKKAIIKTSEGLPLYTQFVLDLSQADGEVLTLENLPPLNAYLFDLLSRLTRSTDLSDAAWRGLTMPILAILAASRSKGALSEGMIIRVLARMGCAAVPENVSRALHCMSAIVIAQKAKNDQLADGDGTIWKLRHDQYRQFLIRDTNFEQFRTAASTALASICREWDNPNLIEAEKRYSAWFHIPELLASDKFDEVIDLAKSETFIEFLKTRVPLSEVLDTMELGIKLAYDRLRLPDAILLSIYRAEWAGREYAGSPIDALRDRKEERALEIVARLENQDDRTLWHLTLAAYHAVGGRYAAAARILDEHLREGALREKLTGGTSLCAVALLCHLIPVRTNRFRWGWFLSRLTDESKELAAETLIRMGDPESAWAMIGAIKRASRRDAARISVVRHLATTDVALAERQLHRFVYDINREWASQEVVAGYARGGNWKSVNRMLKELKLPRQRSKALGIVSVELYENNKAQSDEAYGEALRIIEGPNSDLKVKELSQTYAEIAQTQAEGGFRKEAVKLFNQALEILENAGEIPEPGRRAKITRTQQAVTYAAIIACLSKVAWRHDDYLALLEKATELGIESLQGTSSPNFRDRTRLRILLHLGSAGHHERTEALIKQFESREMRKQGAALLSALRLRLDPDSSAVYCLIRESRNHEERMEIAGRSALELNVKRPVEAVAIVGDTLFAPGISSAWRWGIPRLKAFTAMICENRYSVESNRLRLNQAVSDLKENFDHSKSRIGWHLANFAESAFEFRLASEGNGALIEARLEEHLPKTEKSAVSLKAYLERLEIKQGIKSATEQEIEGFFPSIWNGRNYDLSFSFGLFCRVIGSFALSGRESELYQICQFVFDRVKNDNFFEDPRDRSRWAGEFAVQLAASVSAMPSLEEWIERLLDVCSSNSNEVRDPVDMPDTAQRAEAVLIARTNFRDAFLKASRIGDGEQRSKAFRDIALDSVRVGQYLRVQELCQSQLMVHGRSEHLAEIAECLAKCGDCSDVAAFSLMRRLLVACSDFPDSAYRAAASLIRFLNPTVDDAEKIFEAIDDLLQHKRQ